MNNGYRTQYTAGCYCRLSDDDDQDSTSVSIETQRKILGDFCRQHGIAVHQYYCDATVIIGLKQNPTIGRRFSPIFSFIEHLSGKYGRCYT